MPVPLAIAATGMIVDGVFDEFPNLRVGFLEGGTCWIPMVLDRLERELEYGGLQHQTQTRGLFHQRQNLRAAAKATRRRSPTPSSASARQPFMFASDFPHEISLDNCMEEINEIVERA